MSGFRDGHRWTLWGLYGDSTGTLRTGIGVLGLGFDDLMFRPIYIFMYASEALTYELHKHKQI
jgi:hypothetical protein